MFVVNDRGYHRLVVKIRDLATGRYRVRTLASLGPYSTIETAVAGLTRDLKRAEAELAVLRSSRDSFMWPTRGRILRLEETVTRLREQLEQIRSCKKARSK